MALVLTATGLFLYLHLRSDLDHTLGQGLRSRSRDVSALVQQADTGLRDAAATDSDGPGADFAQILEINGRVFDATPGLSGQPLLTGADLRAARHRSIWVDTPRTRASKGPIRLLAVPARAQDRNLVVVVGAPLADRNRALADLRALLLIGGPGALLLASVAGYGLATAAFRPVESMRRRAASISSEQLDQRLPLSASRDELHRLGQTLNQMLSRLETGMTRERAFTADASHELRTPLTMLKTELELIGRDRPSGPELDRAVKAAVDEADRLATLIDDLLTLARSDSDQLSLRVREIPVAELLAAVKDRYQHSADIDAITVEAADRLVASGDPTRLRQALDNMLDNALRHGRPPVRLSARLDGGLLELHVSDKGSGVPPEFIPHAFERFARADPARGEGGTGLGLTIVDAIAASHRGAAHIANRPDGGTEVWIAIPAAAVGESERRSHSHPHLAGSTA